MPRVWFVKHGDVGKFVEQKNIPDNFDEGLSLGPGYTLLYNLDKFTPNPYLQKFGYIVTNIPGDAVVIYEDNDRIKDIPLNFEDLLPKILKHDEEMRLKFMSTFDPANIIFA